MKDKDTELLPCPFCGNIADLKKCPTSTSPRVYIECSKCGATTKSIYTSLDYCAVKEAAKLWNRRAIPDEVVSEVENAFIAVDDQLCNILNELRRKIEAGDF